MKVKVIIDNEEYETELSALQIEQLKKSKHERWRAELGSDYYFLADIGYVVATWDCRENADNFRYNTGNYGKTEEELEEYKKKNIISATIQRFSRE